MVPLLFVSNVLKMFWLKFSAFPLEKVSIKKIYCVFFKPGKDLWIHGNELFLAEFPAGAVLQETLIPFLQLTNDPSGLLRMVSVKFPVLSMSTHMRVLGFPSTAAWHDSEVPHGQNDWPFWTTLDPFGPLWTTLEHWQALPCLRNLGYFALLSVALQG